MPFSILTKSIAATPILFEAAQTGNALLRSPIAGFQRFEILIQTDYLTSGAVPNLTVSVKPGLFLSPAQGSGVVSNKGFDFNIPAGTALLTVISGVNTANERERNFNTKLTLTDNGGYYQLEIAVEIQNTADLKAYLTTSTVSYDVGRLLRNTNGAAIDLSNATTSVYNSSAQAAFDIYIKEVSTNTVVNAFLSHSFQNSWYDNIALPISNNAVIQNKLFAFKPNLIEIQYTYPPAVAAFTAYNPVVLIVRTSPTQNDVNLPYPTGTTLCSKQIFGAGNIPYPNDPTYWTGYNQNNKIKATGGTNWVLVAGTTYKFNFEIDETLLQVGEKYRIILLAQFQDPGGANDCYHYANVSSELTVVDDKPAASPTATGSLEVYFEKYAADGLEVSPENRIGDNTSLDGAPYNAVRGAGEFARRLTQVSVKLYYDEIIGADTFRHVVTVVSISKNASNLFTPSGGLQATLDVLAQTLACRYDHRLRYEPNLPNLQSFNITNPLAPVQIVPATGNMDMTGKSINVLWEFRLQNDTDVEIFQLPKTLLVDFYDTTTLTFEAQDQDGNPITQLCSDEPQICIKSTGGGMSEAIALLDKDVYGIANIREFDGGAAGVGVTIPSKQESPIISSQSNFVADEHVACIDATQLDLLRAYRYGIIFRKATPFPCYAPYNIFDPDVQALKNRMIAVGFTPSAQYLAIMAGTIGAWKNAGIWAKSDVLYVMVSPHREAAKLNWKSNVSNLTEVNWSTNNYHIPNESITFLGPTAYCNTNYNPFSFAGQFQLNDAYHLSFFTVSGNGCGALDYDGFDNRITYNFMDSNNVYFLNTKSAQPIPPPNLGSPRFNLMTRNNATDVDLFRDTLDNNYAEVSYGIPHTDHYIGAISVAGTPSISATTRPCYFEAYGGSLTLAQRALYYQIVKCYCLSVNPAYFAFMP